MRGVNRYDLIAAVLIAGPVMAALLLAFRGGMP